MRALVSTVSPLRCRRSESVGGSSDGYIILYNLPSPEVLKLPLPTHPHATASSDVLLDQWPKVCADPDATDGTPQLALSARISSTPMVGYREGWGGHELSLQPQVWRFTLIFTRPVPRPRVPFGRSRRVKPLKWSVLRSTVDSGAHLRRFGYPQQKS